MILFFDTETTGLPKNWKAPVTDLDNWPRLVQLAYLVYDHEGNLLYSANEIIKPQGFSIPTEASNVHGITTEIAHQKGSNIKDVLEIFRMQLKRCDVIVAHNMAYDEKIVGSEFIRSGLENLLDNKTRICTMMSTIDLCKIEGAYGYKWPKLEELHRYLFNRDFEGAHDALADIEATARCFWELVKKGLVDDRSILQIPKPIASNTPLGRRTEQGTQKIDYTAVHDIPYRKLNYSGKSNWHFYNIIHRSFTGVEFEDHNGIEEFIRKRGTIDKLWSTTYEGGGFVKRGSLFKSDSDEEQDGQIGLMKWKGWSIEKNNDLLYKNKFVLNIPNVFENEYSIGTGYRLFASEFNFSKVLVSIEVMTHDSVFVFKKLYITLFYIDDSGKIYLENKQPGFDSEADVPFLKIDKGGNPQWQFYKRKKDSFFGNLFATHFDVEEKISRCNGRMIDKLWKTTYDVDYQNELLGVEIWKGWRTNIEGDLLFNEKFRLNIYDLNLTVSFVGGGPIRMIDSLGGITKVIAYCQDGDSDDGHVWFYDYYATLFYLDDEGRIFLENKQQPPADYDFFDALADLAEDQSQRDFFDQEYGLIP